MRPFKQYVNQGLRGNTNVLTLSHLWLLFDMVGRLLLFSLACIFAEITYFRYSQRLSEWIKAHRYCHQLFEWFRKAGQLLQLHPKREAENKNTVELKGISYFAE
ncbi:unnamed protein product [Cylicocyclus nassatus]|uniref:Uncharacterized protein n=1 Tax=Cylicocyclus nassatus TaxID=53992 RepID=A0AA36MDJ3_CYLNA|nr:unnamed protein product [Cylicocyclus nassatus]